MTLLLGRLSTKEVQTLHGRSAKRGHATRALDESRDGLASTDPRRHHVMTLCPRSADSRRAVIIPNLRQYAGPAIVFDSTGEIYKSTADARRALGQTVLRLDPFCVTGPDSDALNPLDLVGLNGREAETDCQMLADMIYPRLLHHDFWESSALGLLTGIVGYIHVVPEKAFPDIFKTLT